MFLTIPWLRGLFARYDLRSSRGFSMPEILVVTAIIGVLAAIAIPTAVSQQARAANASVKADLTNVAATIENALMSWRGKPVEALNLCNNSGTYPVSSAPANNCAESVWEAKTVAGNANPSSGALSGRLSPGITVQGRVAIDGSYCLDGASARTGSTAFRFISTVAQVEEGTCFAAGWTPNGSVAGSTASTQTGTLPNAPTGATVIVDAVAKTATVQWAATSGVAYSVKVSGQPARTYTAVATGTASCIFPAVTCAGPATGELAGGLYTASVRASNTTGFGTSADAEFTIEGSGGGSGTLDDVIVNMASPNPAPVAKVADTRMNLLSNPSLEVNAAGWGATNTSSYVRSTADAYSPASGGASLLVTYNGSGPSAGPYPNNAGSRPDVTAGQAYTYSVYIKEVDAGRTYSANIEWYNASNAYISGASQVSTTTTTTGWTRVSVTGTAPGGAVKAGPVTYTTATPTAGHQTYFDAALFEKASSAEAFFDGSKTGAFWTGSADASTSIQSVSSASHGRAQVSWTVPATAVGQSVTYSVTSNPDNNACTVTGAASCYVTGLDDDTTYTFSVKATSSVGTGTAGVSNSVKTPPAGALAATAPSAPAGLSARKYAGGGISLAWSAPADASNGPPTDYKIEQSTGGVWTTLNDGVSENTTYIVTPLTKDQTYLFRVSAVNSAGTSTPSETVSGQPGYPPEAPVVTGLPVYTPSTGAVTLTTLPMTTTTGTITYLSTYSASATGVTSGNIVGGTGANTVVCNSSACTFTWTGFSNKLGTKWYFYMWAQDDMGIGESTMTSAAAPITTGVASSQVATTVQQCPVGYPIDNGNGTCRVTTPYTYEHRAYTYHAVSIWNSTGWTHNNTGFVNGVYAWCPPGWGEHWDQGWWNGNYGSVNPHCSQDIENGYYTQGQALDATPAGFTSTGTDWVAINPDQPPIGWANSGTNYFKDAGKTNRYTYAMVTALPWNDANMIYKGFGSMSIGGSAAASGVSTDLGYCPGTVAFVLNGIGGSSNGTYAMPCN